MIRKFSAFAVLALLFSAQVDVGAQETELPSTPPDTMLQTQPPTEDAQSKVPTLPETVVEAELREPTSPTPLPNAVGQDFGTGASLGRGQDLIGQAPSASEGRFGQAQLEYRPLNRAGDVLEQVPGMIATQHSGTGKANQYFVRGINLDHGTDFAVRVDGVPINLPSNGHGQGYLDVNWLIPEMIEYADYKLGTYYADVGDFSSAGALDIRLRRTLPHGIATVTAGQFDYYRVLVADSGPLRGGQLLYAYESVFYDGPWDLAEDFNKFNGMLRWSIGDECEGFAITTQAYRGYWNATNQIPRRAVEAGMVGRFGTLDPSDAGATTRVGMNLEYWREHCFAHEHSKHVPSDRVAKCNQKLHQQPDRISFGMWLNRADKITCQAVKR